MAYRQTTRTRANAQQRRDQIETAARHVIARGGFRSASIVAVAAEAGCSTGLIYSYYTNRDELLRSVFAQAAGHELATIAAAVDQAETVGALAESVVTVFIQRAVAGRRLAHALLLEEVPDPVQLERLLLRRGYVAAIAAGLLRVRVGAAEASAPGSAGGAGAGEAGGADNAGPAGEGLIPTGTRLIPSGTRLIPAEVVARSIVGSVAENLVDVLDPAAPPSEPAQIRALITALSAFTRTALGEP